MASVCADPNGTRRVTFYRDDGTRGTLYLGRVSHKHARAVANHIEALERARKLGTPLELAAAQWLRRLSPWLRAKMARVGLLAELHEARILEDLLGEQLARPRAASTRRNWEAAARELRACFGAAKPLRTFTADDGRRFADHLRKKTTPLSPATVRQRIETARAAFAAAVEAGTLERNPLARIRVTTGNPKARAAYVSPEDLARLLDRAAAPWRTLLALARLGGLRTPSETHALRWQDIDWHRDRIRVTSPKTAHHAGKESRTVPLYGELRPILEEAYELAPEGATHVVILPRRGLARPLRRMIEAAGLPQWPRLWNALRSSRETDLLERFPAHVVCAFQGHDRKIQDRHYALVTEAHYRKAALNPAPHRLAPSRKSSPSKCPSRTAAAAGARETTARPARRSRRPGRAHDS